MELIIGILSRTMNKNVSSIQNNAPPPHLLQEKKKKYKEVNFMILYKIYYGNMTFLDMS